MGSSARLHCIVIGLGNPILGDDGIGWRVAEEVQARLTTPISPEMVRKNLDIEFDFLSLGGLSLMEHLIGFDYAIIIDAISSGHNPVGTVARHEINDFETKGVSHLTSTHDTSLLSAIEIGRSLEAELPKSIAIVAIEVEINYQFSDSLSEAAADAIPLAADLVIQVLDEISRSNIDRD